MKTTMKGKTVTLITLMFVIFAGCSDRSGKMAQHIPESAIFVAVIDQKKMMRAYDYNSIKNSQFFRDLEREILYEQPELLQPIEKLIEDPSSSGISMRDKIFVFGILDMNMEYEPTIGVLVGINEKRFENAYESIIRASGITGHDLFREGYGFKYIFEDDGTLLAYNRNILLFLINESRTWRGGNYGPDLLEMANNILNKKEPSVTGNKDFNAFLANSKDMSVWAYSAVLKENRDISRDMRDIQRILGFNPLETYGQLHLEMKKNKIEITATFGNENFSSFNLARMLDNLDYFDF